MAIFADDRAYREFVHRHLVPDSKDERGRHAAGGATRVIDSVTVRSTGLWIPFKKQMMAEHGFQRFLTCKIKRLPCRSEWVFLKAVAKAQFSHTARQFYLGITAFLFSHRTTSAGQRHRCCMRFRASLPEAP